jgi:peptidoglycan/xylan/chitin deacetylase (PgdA/CDA1 family)
VKKAVYMIFLILIVTTIACHRLERESNESPTSPSPISGNFSGGLISFTFDDGRTSAYNNAIPALDAAGFKSTNYIITGRFSSPGYIGTSQVLSLQSRGHEVGAHTRTHQDLRLMTAEQMRNEIAGSRTDLLNIGIGNVTTFAYPFGSYNQMAVDIIRNSGFSGARTSDAGFNSQQSDRFRLKRQNLGANVSLNQAQAWIDSAIRDRSWLIFVVHSVDNAAADDFTITPDLFRRIVNYTSSHSIKVITVREGIQMLRP